MLTATPSFDLQPQWRFYSRNPLGQVESFVIRCAAKLLLCPSFFFFFFFSVVLFFLGGLPREPSNRLSFNATGVKNKIGRVKGKIQWKLKMTIFDLTIPPTSWPFMLGRLERIILSFSCLKTEKKFENRQMRWGGEVEREDYKRWKRNVIYSSSSFFVTNGFNIFWNGAMENGARRGRRSLENPVNTLDLASMEMRNNTNWKYYFKRNNGLKNIWIWNISF